METSTAKREAALSKQQLLNKLLKNKAINSKTTITKGNRSGNLPLSWAQQQLWYISQVDIQASQAYHVSVVVRLKGHVDEAAFNRAFNTILSRHEVLRTNFRVDEQGQAYQYIHTQREFTLGKHVLVDEPVAEQKQESYQRLIEQLVSTPFDLSSDSLIRANLIKVEEGDYVLLLVLHHIVSDAWSMGVLTEELSSLYRAYISNNESPLKDLSIQYGDYVLWQRKRLQGLALENDVKYWEDRLKDLVPLELPSDRPRPAVKSYRGAMLPFQIEMDLVQQLKALGKEHGCTMFMTLLAVFKVLLQRYTQQTDLCVGTPVANRMQAELAPLIGYFVNTVAIRTELDINASFTSLLEKICKVTRSAYEHQMLPFDRVVEAVQPERSEAYSPIFQVMMVLQNVVGSKLDMQGLALEYEQPVCTTSKFDLTLILEEMPDGTMHAGFEYATDLFDTSTIAHIQRHFVELIKSIVQAPSKALHEFEVLTEDDKQQLLVEWNKTVEPSLESACIHEIFEAQVEKTPHVLAVVCNQRTLTYQELNNKANQLAHYLIAKGVTPDTLVGICLERSIDMIVAIMGILKAGGAYVPLDPEYPVSRLSYMQDDASLGIVLTHNSVLAKGNIAKEKAVILDSNEVIQEIQCYPVENIAAYTLGLTPLNLAYVIYTSGSTGQPKGVLLPHRGPVNTYQWYGDKVLNKEARSKGKSEKVLLLSSISFDLTQKNILATLMYGHAIVIPAMEYFEPLIAYRCAQSHDVTIINCAPSVWVSMEPFVYDQGLPNLKYLVLGGEALDKFDLQRFSEKQASTILINSYGPTECSDVTTYYTCRATSATPLPIGVRIHNIQHYILDGGCHLVPIGSVGELYIGGVGLALGYLNQPELTEEKFITNPFSDNPQDKLYKTGDLCRYLKDGNIRYVGRADHQVKIRGLRIELGEIEAALITHKYVDDATVLVKEDASGNTNLVAYWVANKGVEGTSGDACMEIKKHLTQIIPNYMLPAALVQLQSLPLTPNGKVDRKVLLSLDVVALGGSEKRVVPTTETEKNTVKIWADVLGAEVNTVSLTDNFFNVGGNSLLLLQMKYQLDKVFCTEINVRDILSNPTLEMLALHIQELKSHQGFVNIDQYEALDENILKELVEKNKVLGCKLSAYDNGQISRLCVGIDDNDINTEMGENARYSILCFAKVIVSYTTLILCDRGYLDLDGGLFNQMGITIPADNILSKITIKNILTQSSGIDDSDMEYLHSHSHSLEAFCNKFLESGTVMFTPGASYLYSSSGIILCAYAIERAMGRSWLACADKYLLSPLGIDLDTVKQANKSTPTYYKGNSQGKYIKVDAVQEWPWIKPAETRDIYLNTDEVLKIALLVLNEGKTLEGELILSHVYIDLMRKQHTKIDNHFVMDGWSVGWMQFTPHVFGFNTGGFGSHTIVAFSDKAKKAIAIQANTEHGIELFQEIIYRFLGEDILKTEYSVEKLDIEKCCAAYEASGIKLRITYDDKKTYASVRYLSKTGVWGEEAKCEMMAFNPCSLVCKGSSSVLGGVASFCDFDASGYPAALRIKQTLCHRK